MANDTITLRISRLARQMKKTGLDAVIIPPSGDMNYFMGFDPGGCERFQALVITADSQCFCVTNSLYLEDMRAHMPEAAKVYEWDDGHNFHDAVIQGFSDHGLTRQTIGINAAVRGTDLLTLAALFQNCRFLDADHVISTCRLIKTPEELTSLKEAGRQADQAMEEIKEMLRPGISERQVKNAILDLFAARGLAPSFAPIVASGTNNSRPHYNRDDRILTPRDVLVLDFGCKVNGFCSDTSRTFFIGTPTPKEVQIYGIVKEAFEAAAAAIKPGASAGDVDHGARSVIQQAGYGHCFINRTGHGIGMDVHERPFIRENSTQILEPGMAFSIEPGIYIAGEVGMRIEDIFIVNDQGFGQSLNHSDKTLTIL